MKKIQKSYYERHKEKCKAQQREYKKRINYKNEKTPVQRFIRNIKRQTRLYYPLLNHYCEFCGVPATEHHHNTNPIQFDKFNFVCKDCHNRIHKEEKQNGNTKTN